MLKRIIRRGIVDICLTPLALISAMMPKKPNLWLFGYLGGRRYVDHSRYLFEHVLSAHPEIDAHWVTSSATIFAELKKRGLPVLLRNSLKGFLITLRAAVCVYSHYASDHNRTAANGAYKVQLWHGIPLKRVKADSGISLGRSPSGGERIFISAVRKFQKALTGWAAPTWDLLVFQSDIDRERAGSAFRGTYRSHITAGSIRASYLERQKQRSNSQDRAEEGFRILYAPTHRVHGAVSLFERVPAPTGPVLQSRLDDMKAFLEVRLHPSQAQEEIPDAFRGDRVQIVHDDPFSDPYDNLPRIDALITDYSSIFIDALPLGLPIIFLAPDRDEYASADLGFYEDFNPPGPVVDNWDQALDALEPMLIGKDQWRARRVEAADFYFRRGGKGAPMEAVVAAIKNAISGGLHHQRHRPDPAKAREIPFQG